MQTIRLLSREDIKQAVAMSEAIDLMRDAFVALSRGEVRAPVRMNVGMPEFEAHALFMPVYSPAHKQLAQKVVAIHPNNVRHGLPFIHALVLLFDAVTGEPLSVMDGEYITALRTGAASGLATRLLARKDVSTAAVFGAGTQARTQLSAVLAVRALERILVFGRSRKNAERFAAEIQEKHGITAAVVRRAADLAQADIICTATTSLTPVFDDAHIGEGCHINGVGSFRPDMTEIPFETVCRASVFVDQRAAALEEAGDLIVPIRNGYISAQHIRAELGEVAMGKADGRTSVEEITFFKSVGNAMQDLVVAGHAYQAAKVMELGQEVQL